MRREPYSLLLVVGFALGPRASLAQAGGGPAEDPSPPPATSPASPAPFARPKLPQTMGLLVVETSASGGTVRLNGEPVGQAPLPGPWTLAPGRHAVEIEVTGQPPARAEVMVSAGELHRVSLLRAAAPVSPAAATEVGRIVRTGAGFSLRTAGYVSAGVGAAAGIGGVVLGLLAEGAAADARGLNRMEPANSRADQDELSGRAQRLALGANLLYGVAGVAAASGLGLLLFGRDGFLAPTAAPQGAGVAVGGGF